MDLARRTYNLGLLTSAPHVHNVLKWQVPIVRRSGNIGAIRRDRVTDSPLLDNNHSGLNTKRFLDA